MHSSCSQLFNEYEYGINMVKLATDHARMKSVKKYAKVVLPARKTLLKKKVVHLPKSSNETARKSEGNIQLYR